MVISILYVVTTYSIHSMVIVQYCAIRWWLSQSIISHWHPLLIHDNVYLLHGNGHLYLCFLDLSREYDGGQNRQLSISYQNLYPSEVIAATSRLLERRKSAGWVDAIPSHVDYDLTSRSGVVETDDDVETRRALDEIESIHLRLLAEMSDVDDDIEERRFFAVYNDDVIRRCRSVGCLSTYAPPLDAFYGHDDRRSKSSCYLDLPPMLDDYRYLVKHLAVCDRGSSGTFRSEHKQY